MSSAHETAPTEPAAAATRGQPGEYPGTALRFPVHPSPDVALAAARHHRAEGDVDGAAQLVEVAIRDGGWRRGRLWSELVALMQGPEDYTRIRDLWHCRPDAARAPLSVTKAVARAACIGGRHEEGRTLLRMAVLQASQDRRRGRLTLARPRSVARNALRRERVTHDSSGPETFAGAAAEALKALDQRLTALGVRSFLISGTLLGLLREGDFISWDKDIDVGVFSEEIAPADLERAFTGFGEFTVRRLDFTDRVRVNHVNGTGIDVFPHYQDDSGLVWHDGAATRWWNTPFGLRRADFLGVEFSVPAPPERYLDENYGDWRTPDPHFDARLDAPNVEVTDPEYFTSLLLFSLLDAIRKGKREKEARMVGLLREAGEAAWLARI